MFILIIKTIKRMFKKPRTPSTYGRLIALTGAVVVWTRDGNIVITPELARQISNNLSHVADESEKQNAR